MKKGLLDGLMDALDETGGDLLGEVLDSMNGKDGAASGGELLEGLGNVVGSIVGGEAANGKGRSSVSEKKTTASKTSSVKEKAQSAKEKAKAKTGGTSHSSVSGKKKVNP